MNLSLFQSRIFRFWATGLGVLIVVLVVCVYFFPWDTLRGPINRYVSGQLGRRFEITRNLSVHLGRTTTVRAEEVEIANPEWAENPFFLKARVAEFDIKLLPLLFGKLVLPRLSLIEPKIGLQIEPDGRRTWALSRDSSKKDAVPEIGALLVDQGVVTYRARAQGADIHADFSLTRQSGAPLPLSFRATGKWKNQTFFANGYGGEVLRLSSDAQAPFPLDLTAVAGRTTLRAKGSIAGLADLAGIDVTFDLKGQDIEELYNLLGVVLPHTPPYELRGKLDKHGRLWAVSQIRGTLGKSDLNGALSFDQSAAVPLLTGKLQSKVMDFADLGPIIGIVPANVPASSKKPAIASNVGKSEPAGFKKNASRAPGGSGKVLPTAPLDVPKLNAMNADVIYSAADIRHVRQLPLDRANVHVKLNAGLLQLEPISLGVAGGTVAGSIRIDSNMVPAAVTAKLDVRAVQLNQLLPAVKNTKSALGKISGQFDLTGRGNSVAQTLGSATGNMAVLMGKGEISNILLEFIGLDGGEVIKFLVLGDRNVQLQCAAVAFDLKQGVMTSRAIVLDTSDTIVTGGGKISLADETLDIMLDAAPKDRSILSFRSPLRIGGTFGAPSAGPEKAALAGRVGLALLLGAINPLLGLASTIETGPGKDADCAAVLALAAKPKPTPKLANK